MEERNVTYTLRSCQRLEGEADELTQTGRGRLAPLPGGWRLWWDEPAGAGMGATRTALTLRAGEAVLTRTGETVSRMDFRPGEKHTSPYRTLYGDLPMTLLTQTLEWEMGEKGGTVRLSYGLSLAGGPMTETEMTVTVAPWTGEDMANKPKSFS